MRSLPQPHNLYLLIAAFFSIAFIIVTPPFGAADEPVHFERAYEVATGQWLGADLLPAPMLDFETQAFDQVVAKRPFNGEDYRQLTHFTFSSDSEMAEPYDIKKIFKVHNPIAYLPIALGMRIGLTFELPVITVFYLCRLIAFITGVGLVYSALRIAPAYRYSLCAVALLPTPLFFTGMLNVESLHIGLAFLFFALLLRYRHEQRIITTRQIGLLAIIALLLALCKTAYMLIPFASLLLPLTCFTSPARRKQIMLLLIIPGLIGSLSWGVIAKQAILGSVPTYSTWGGDHVEPDAQLRYVIQEPVTYAVTILRTLLTTKIVPESFTGYIAMLGHSHIMLPIWSYAIPVFCLVLLLANHADRASFAWPMRQKLWLGTMCATTVLISLSLLYLQWTGLHAKVIQGFQGRYLIALTPWLLCLLPPATNNSQGTKSLILAFSGITLFLCIALYTLWRTFHV